jgi:hypothetical protein
MQLSSTLWVAAVVLGSLKVTYVCGCGTGRNGSVGLGDVPVRVTGVCQQLQSAHVGIYHWAHLPMEVWLVSDRSGTAEQCGCQ